jgi:glycosyltransferase involved in cell wall biosynthesis
MRILRVVRTLDPAAGGVAEAIRQFTRYFSTPNETVMDVVSLDDPFASWLKQYPSAFGIGPVYNGYGYQKDIRRRMMKLVKGYQFVILDGIWQYHSRMGASICRELHIPYAIYPHGMLDQWFNRQYPIKYAKKLLYWMLYERAVLRDARTIIYTTEAERLASIHAFPFFKSSSQVLPLGIAPPNVDLVFDKEKLCQDLFGKSLERYVIFLGRLHEKKGCDLLIKAFGRVSADFPDVCLVMAGPAHDGIDQQLRMLARQNSVDNKVIFTGMLATDRKWAALALADAFILPSHQENFGIAVVEALACSVPVLISNKVNLYTEIENYQCGVVDDDTVDGVERQLRIFLSLTSEHRALMKMAALRCFSERFNIDQAAKLFLLWLNSPSVNSCSLGA